MNTYERAIFDVAKLFLRDYGDAAVDHADERARHPKGGWQLDGTRILGAGSRSHQGAVAHGTASRRNAALVAGAIALERRTIAP